MCVCVHAYKNKKHPSYKGEACRSIENRWLNDECRKWNLPEFQIDTQRIDENAAAATTLVEDDVDYKGSPHRCRFLKTKTDH